MKKVALILLAGVLLFSSAALAQYDGMPAGARVFPLGEPGLFENAEVGVQGGTIYVTNIEDPKGWNDAVAHETSTTTFTNRMHDSLVGYNQISSAIVPELAESYEVSDDSLTITFHLRQGIKWSDGEPITADDIAFTYNDLILNDDIDNDSSDGLILPDGTFPVLEVIDDYTVAFHMSVIFRPVLNSFSFNIMPEHALSQYVAKLNPDLEPGYFNTNAWNIDTPLEELVGCGPYIPVAYQPNVSVTCERNPYYYAYDNTGTQLPYYDKYVNIIVTNEDVSLLKFRNGEADVLGIRPEDIPVLLPDAASKDYTVLITEEPNYGTRFFTINQDIGLADGSDAEKRELYRNLQFRTALAHAVDEQTMIDNVLNGMGAELWCGISLGSPFYPGRANYGGTVDEAAAVIYEYDLALAASILDEIGVVDQDGDGWRDMPSGEALEIELNTNDNTIRTNYCLIYQDDLRAIGINANFQVVDFNTLVTQLLGGTGDVIMIGLTGSDEPNGGSNTYKSGGALHMYRLSDSEGDLAEYQARIDELYGLGTGTFDNEEAFGYYQEAHVLSAQNLDLSYIAITTLNYAYYNYVGNANLVSTTSSPAGNNGYLTELCFDKRLKN